MWHNLHIPDSVRLSLCRESILFEIFSICRQRKPHIARFPSQKGFRCRISRFWCSPNRGMRPVATHFPTAVPYTCRWLWVHRCPRLSHCVASPFRAERKPRRRHSRAWESRRAPLSFGSANPPWWKTDRAFAISTRFRNCCNSVRGSSIPTDACFAARAETYRAWNR